MAAPISGLWSQLNANANDYTGALRWGTGASPIFGQFGEGPPTGITGRVEGPGIIGPNVSGRDQYAQVPSALMADPALEWGYTLEDIMPGGEWQEFMADFPDWTERPEVTRAHTEGFPPPSFQARPNGPSGKYFHTLKDPPSMLEDATTPHSYPTETVTEGWEHKQHGEILDAVPSSRHQYERQTSMQQVNPAPGRNNDLAVERGTDDARFNIMTRLTGMKIKPFSEGERLGDMFPYQQDLMLRPFWFRNAATGKVEWLQTNEFAEMLPVQRTPPIEPDYGPLEGTGELPDFGFTPEDVF